MRNASFGMVACLALVASDTGITDICAVIWRPLWTGPFTIRVVNRGAVYNRFTIRAE